MSVTPAPIGSQRDRLTLLTTDHVRPGGNGRSNILTRALGVETEVRLDYTTQPVAQHDRFLLCSDGIHGRLTAGGHRRDHARARLAPRIPRARWWRLPSMPASADNCTALVLDVVGLETARIGRHRRWPSRSCRCIPLPQGGEAIDGFVLKVLLSDGRYTRLFGAEDEVEGGEVALKFPKPQLASVREISRGFRARGLGGRAGVRARGSAMSSNCRRSGRAASTP